MIPVIPQEEPANFDEKVRKPGLKWLLDNHIAPGHPPPDASKLPPYWRETQKALWNANRFDDILDPFQVQHQTFVLNLVSGQIRPGPGLSPSLAAQAEETIKRLKLDDAETKDMRAEHFANYLGKHVDEYYLARHSPFVWYEAKRQGLL